VNPQAHVTPVWYCGCNRIFDERVSRMNRRPDCMNLFRSPLAFLLLFALVPALAQPDPARGPRPELDPQQTVEAMLAALKKNSDQGIAELYRFSSPGNREKTGPLEQFRAMIRDYFPDMLGHRSARLVPPLIDGDRAMQPVEMLGSDGQPHRYIFILSRQNLPDCRGCWMADAVFSPDGDEAPDGDAPPGQPAPELGA
jgi:hypothetical protein